MDQFQFLLKAQEADAVADAAQDPTDRTEWQRIAREYRELAGAAAEMGRLLSPT